MSMKEAHGHLLSKREKVVAVLKGQKFQGLLDFQKQKFKGKAHLQVSTMVSLDDLTGERVTGETNHTGREIHYAKSFG